MSNQLSCHPGLLQLISTISVAVTAIGCSGCLSPTVDAKHLLGSKLIPVTTVYYNDFLGISSHGELFDFQECKMDTVDLNNLIQSSAFRQAPDYSLFQDFYKGKLQGVACSAWQKTPITPIDSAYFHTILQFGNLQDDDHSRQFLQKKYLNAPGNFYAYFVAYPLGSNLYILVPKEGKAFIIRQRG